jgi:hypothetical protein
MKNDPFPFPMEYIRSFFVKRNFLVGKNRPRDLLTPAEYKRLKDRSLSLTRHRIDYLFAFIDGWTHAKE